MSESVDTQATATSEQDTQQQGAQKKRGVNISPWYIPRTKAVHRLQR